MKKQEELSIFFLLIMMIFVLWIGWIFRPVTKREFKQLKIELNEMKKSSAIKKYDEYVKDKYSIDLDRGGD